MVFMATAASSKPVLRESRRAVKPGDIMALNPASCWVAGSSLPRTMRHRKGKTMRAGRSSSPGSPHQDVATNMLTGRQALGPWLGPFSTVRVPADNQLPKVIFADTRGTMHLGLDAEEHLKLVRALQETQEQSGLLSTSTAALEAASAAAAAKLTADLMHMRKAQARQAQNAYLRSCTVEVQHEPRAAVRRMRHLNQPRKMN